MIRALRNLARLLSIARTLARHDALFPLESIRRFPAQDDFAALIGAAGLGNVRYRNLTGGVAALHSAWRI